MCQQNGPNSKWTHDVGFICVDCDTPVTIERVEDAGGARRWTFVAAGGSAAHEHTQRYYITCT